MNPAKKYETRVVPLQVERPGKTGLRLITDTFQREADTRDGSTYETWRAALAHWEAYRAIRPGKKSMAAQVKGFREYLLKQVAHNSAATYWAKFKTVMNACFDDGMDKFKIPSLTSRETHREHLSLSEIRSLAETEVMPAELKQMALFSAKTGMRWSDIAKLDYEDLVQTDSGPAVRFVQQKTGRVEYMPIDDQAREYLGTGHGRIFTLRYSSYLNEILCAWCRAAGIDRKITFHAFRHSYACIQLEAGTDIYTVSKGLGHSKVSTTEVYAKISDAKKREAAGKIII